MPRKGKFVTWVTPSALARAHPDAAIPLRRTDRLTPGQGFAHKRPQRAGREDRGPEAPAYRCPAGLVRACAGRPRGCFWPMSRCPRVVWGVLKLIRRPSMSARLSSSPCCEDCPTAASRPRCFHWAVRNDGFGGPGEVVRGAGQCAALAATEARTGGLPIAKPTGAVLLPEVSQFLSPHICDCK